VHLSSKLAAKMAFSTLVEAQISELLAFQVTAYDGDKKYINLRELASLKHDANKTVYTRNGVVFEIGAAPTLLKLIQQSLAPDNREIAIFRTDSPLLTQRIVFHIARIEPQYYMMTVKKSSYTGSAIYLHRSELSTLCQLLNQTIQSG